jgi:dienelactone hydrolase
MVTDYPSGTGKTPIPVRVFTPTTATFNKKAVVVAYGTEGLNGDFGPLIDDGFCQVLADQGFLVARPEFFKKTATTAGMEPVFLALNAGQAPQWVEAIVDAVEWVQSNTAHGVASGRVALIGFSLGANLVLHAASKTKVKAVVDFFGPITQLPQVTISKSELTGFPPTQIHHGKEDKVVPFSESDVVLRGYLADNKVPFFEVIPYPRQGHPGQSKDSWKDTTQAAATAAVVKFLETHV